MFCSKCGTENPDSASACVKCGTPIAGHHTSSAHTSGHTADTVKGAGKDALEALKIFAANPVPGLPKAFKHLGPARALGAGIGFGVVTALCFVAWVYLFFRGFGAPSGVGTFLKILLWAVVPFASLVGGCFGARLVFSGKGAISHDCFIAGASLLPIGALALLAGILGASNMQAVSFIAPFAFCTAVLLLFSGCVRILYMTERAATIAVPIMIIISYWLSETIYKALMRM